ncbi:hypothetical protein KIN20_009981 [Parelaphostrongylus tenuis]|uniref:Apple domain-containing protein n=1 Tax=Parelaphostrongylus tenuis TaxID=148309 RepID=A0AAD5MTB7_PARTN|nr:hypothetical protein KIN20_009981 [Parelaphostrongylus tenuis]
MLQPLPKSRFGSCDRVHTIYDAGAFEESIRGTLRVGSSSAMFCRLICRKDKKCTLWQVYSDTPNCDPPGEFEYISSNDFSSCSEPEDNEGIAMVKCKCTDFVCSEECASRQMSDKFTKCTIQGDGRVYLHSRATYFNTLLVGCGGKCACRRECKNSLSGKLLPSPFTRNQPKMHWTTYL